MKKRHYLILALILSQVSFAQQLPSNFHLTKLKNGLEVLVD